MIAIERPWQPPIKKPPTPLWMTVALVTRGLRLDPRQLGGMAKMDHYAQEMTQRDALATYVAGSDHRAEMEAANKRARRLAQRKGRVFPN